MAIYYLEEQLANAWPEHNTFDYVMALDGKLYRDMPARRTLRFCCAGRPFFAKLHYGVGWLEIIKNLLTGRKPIIDAGTEWRAIRRLTEIGVETMQVAGYGVRGINPARRQSFLITESLENTESLEDFCRDWQNSPPNFRLRLALFNQVATISRTLHQHGVNHRDYYICHFLLDLQAGRDTIDPRRIRLYLIDLHRAQIRRKVPERWLIKDLGSLYFSALDLGLTQKDLLRFIALYSDAPLRQTLKDNQRFWQKVTRRAVYLYKKMHGVAPQLPG